MSFLRPLSRKLPYAQPTLSTPLILAPTADAPAKLEPSSTRELQDLSEIIEAELDSANANCQRQGAEAVARARVMTDEAQAIALKAGEGASTALLASQNVTAVAAASDQLSAAAREIAMQASRSSQIAREAVSTSDNAARAVEELGSAAMAINDVVRSIAAIASRTNLLALNATIEAARAGEAGRGFSVVAAEVKELSRQTASATQDIAQRIRRMQEATSGSVVAMNGVGSAVRQMDEANTAVAAAIVQQDATLQQISERLNGASANTCRVAETISEVAGLGANLGRLSQQTHDETCRTNARVDEMRGNVFLVLRRVAALAGEWSEQVPLQADGVLETRSWSGGVTVLELSDLAATLRLPPQGYSSIGDIGENEDIRLVLPNLGTLRGCVAGASHGRLLMIFSPQQDDVLARLRAAVAHIRQDDRRFVDVTVHAAGRIGDAIERAIAEGSLTAASVFDRSHVEVKQSNPRQYTTAFTSHADRLVRPILDELLAFDDNVVGCFIVDRSGYAPTHNLRVSQEQRPDDEAWNAKHARNRRMFDDRAGLAAGRNTKPYLLQSYERDMGGGERMMIKEADAPIYVSGRHWGGFRMMFRNDKVDWSSSVR